MGRETNLNTVNYTGEYLIEGIAESIDSDLVYIVYQKDPSSYLPIQRGKFLTLDEAEEHVRNLSYPRVLVSRYYNKNGEYIGE